MIENIYKEVIEKVESEIPKSAHLCHFFIMPPSSFNFLVNEIDKKDSEIHVGFFNKDSKKIFSYKLFEDKMELIPEQDIFQKNQEDVAELDLDKIKISLNDAMDILRKEVKDKYKDTVSFKTMIVLQKLKDLGVVWNLTVLRRDFKTVNIKIDAKSGDIKSSSCSSIIDFNKSK